MNQHERQKVVAEFLRAKRDALQKISAAANPTPKAKAIARLSDEATATLFRAAAITPGGDVERRWMRRPVMLTRERLQRAALIKQCRALRPSGNPVGRSHPLGHWLLYHATPDDFRAIAEALNLEDENLDLRHREKLLEAYQSALEQSDPKFRWWDESIPNRVAVSALAAKKSIEFPPTFRAIKEHFVALFRIGWPWKPGEEWSPRKTLTQYLKLPLAKAKPTGGPKKRRNQRRFRVA